MKLAIPALRMLIFMTVLTGIGYPLMITGLGQVFFKAQANGSLLRKNGVVAGSSLISQKFTGPKYFWPRPSAIDYNPLPSGGSNLSQTSADLKKAFEERKAAQKAAHPGVGEPPQDLLFASGSGLDPHISPEAARYQIARVASARQLDPEKVALLVAKFSEGRQLGIFGEPRVNVLELNLALDDAPGGASP